MGDTAIQVQGLGKQYVIGRRLRTDRFLTEALAKAALYPLRALRPGSNGFASRQRGNETIWALKDVSFDVEHGEVVGIIGQNGAGKSTLLKILSRITEPTVGAADIHGRLGALIEVGAGFHQELTGRENIYLNGAILGMRKAEIDRKLDAIVAFAEVEKFIDTPIKHYSTGMNGRLAFAVAAHFEPDILLVDEVLSVGDTAFQKKCFAKMDDMSGTGRTVLFVSHNMQAVKRLCTKAFLLHHGALVESGTPDRVIAAYLKTSQTVQLAGMASESLGGVIELERISVIQDGHEAYEFVDNQKPFEVQLHYRVLQETSDLLLGFDVYSADGGHIFRTYDMLSCGLGRREPGLYTSVCRFPPNLFKARRDYFFHLLAGIHLRSWLSRGKISFRLNFDGPRSTDVHFDGLILPLGEWTVTRESELRDDLSSSRIGAAEEQKCVASSE
jgi:lipopolysaccharide transport system ATP-binding protein